MTQPIATRGASSETNARKALLILGMHRTGTSAFTRVLNLLGADLPADLLPPAADNPTGFWESRELKRLHDEILASAGSSWDDWRSFDPTWYASPVAAGFRARLVDFLDRHFKQSRLFVVKDPRICRVLPLWTSVLGEFGAVPLAVIPLRNPAEVADSLRARDGLDFSVGSLIWLRHVLAVEQGTRDLKRVFVPFSWLLSDWHTAVSAVSQKLGIDWPHSSSSVEAAIQRFLAPELRHHAESDERFSRRAGVPAWVRRSYQLLLGLVTQDAPDGVGRELDQIAAEFDTAAEVFGTVVAGLSAHKDLSQRAATALGEELRAVRAACEAAEAAEKNLRGSAEKTAREKAQAELLARKATEDADTIRRRHEQLASETAAIRDQNAQLTASLAAALDEKARAEAAAEEGRRWRLELPRARAELDRQGEATARVTAELQQTRDKLAIAQTLLGRMEAEYLRVIGSRAWRVTYPLRLTMRVAGTLVRRRR